MQLVGIGRTFRAGPSDWIQAVQFNPFSCSVRGGVARAHENRPHALREACGTVISCQGLHWATVTTPDGRLLALASREDLEPAADPE